VRFSKWERRFALASIETLTLARLRRLQGGNLHARLIQVVGESL
jgi:hypothetical protein